MAQNYEMLARLNLITSQDETITQLRAELAEAKEAAEATAKQLQSEVDELDRDREKLMQLIRLRAGTNAVHGEFDGVEILARQRDEAIAHAERLREALETVGSKLDKCKTYAVGSGLSRQTIQNCILGMAYHRAPYSIRHIIFNALDDTPAHSLAKLKAAALREAKHEISQSAQKAESDECYISGADDWTDTVTQLESIAERREKEAQ